MPDEQAYEGAARICEQVATEIGALDWVAALCAKRIRTAAGITEQAVPFGYALTLDHDTEAHL